MYLKYNFKLRPRNFGPTRFHRASEFMIQSVQPLCHFSLRLSILFLFTPKHDNENAINST